MPRYRSAERDSAAGSALLIAVGALAGFAAGMIVAERFGGISALVGRLRRGAPKGSADGDNEFDDDDFDDEFEDLDDEEMDVVPEGVALRREMEERVLAAFTNDPVLSERALDIGALSATTMELSGWVNAADEAQHAVTIARGVPGVEAVVNHILIGDQEAALEAIRDGDEEVETVRGRAVRSARARREDRRGRRVADAAPDRDVSPTDASAGRDSTT